MSYTSNKLLFTLYTSHSSYPAAIVSIVRFRENTILILLAFYIFIIV